MFNLDLIRVEKNKIYYLKTSLNILAILRVLDILLENDKNADEEN